MSRSKSEKDRQRIYRVDKFEVPASAHDEFADRVARTHALLRTLPGFVDDLVLEQVGGPGAFNFVTIAIWDSAEAIQAARNSVAAKYKEIGFNPEEMLARLEIKADIANYKQIAS